MATVLGSRTASAALAADGVEPPSKVARVTPDDSLSEDGSVREARFFTTFAWEMESKICVWLTDLARNKHGLKPLVFQLSYSEAKEVRDYLRSLEPSPEELARFREECKRLSDYPKRTMPIDVGHPEFNDCGKRFGPHWNTVLLDHLRSGNLWAFMVEHCLAGLRCSEYMHELGEALFNASAANDAKAFMVPSLGSYMDPKFLGMARLIMWDLACTQTAACYPSLLKEVVARVFAECFLKMPPNPSVFNGMGVYTALIRSNNE